MANEFNVLNISAGGVPTFSTLDDFPSNPNVGDRAIADGGPTSVLYRWDGTKWAVESDPRVSPRALVVPNRIRSFTSSGDPGTRQSTVDVPSSYVRI